MASPRVGVVSCSSPVGLVELDRGLKRLRLAGFEVVEHPNARARHFVNAGHDLQRANSLLDFAFDDAIDVIWCARGGYGAARVATLLEAETKRRGTPRPKTLVGYSDVTFLHEFVRQRWNWRTIHASMVSAPATTDAEWDATDALVRGEAPALPYVTNATLRWLLNPPSAEIEAELVGGNLSLWANLAGTPWQPSGADRILFFEDIAEKLYRLDRYVVQVEQAGMFEGCRAIVLGDFTDCDDESPTMLAPDGDPQSPRVAMRPTLTLEAGLLEIFGRVADRLGVPLAAGLPVGHGPNFWPLTLGTRHVLTVDGRLLP